MMDGVLVYPQPSRLGVSSISFFQPFTYFGVGKPSNRSLHSAETVHGYSCTMAMSQTDPSLGEDHPTDGDPSDQVFFKKPGLFASQPTYQS